MSAPLQQRAQTENFARPLKENPPSGDSFPRGTIFSLQRTTRLLDLLGDDFTNRGLRGDVQLPVTPVLNGRQTGGLVEERVDAGDLSAA